MGTEEDRIKEAFLAGFLAGWEDSAEGWNGEYPGEMRPDQEARWEERKTWALDKHMSKWQQDAAWRALYDK